MVPQPHSFSPFLACTYRTHRWQHRACESVREYLNMALVYGALCSVVCYAAIYRFSAYETKKSLALLSLKNSTVLSWSSAAAATLPWLECLCQVHEIKTRNSFEPCNKVTVDHIQNTVGV